MRITSRRKAIAFFLTLGVGLAAVAVAVGMGWVILNWREGVKVFLGVVFFGAIIAGIILNTIFLIREIRRNEQHDSFINAVTHELKTPITSIRLYLQTLQRRDVDEARRKEFYRLMLDDADRLLVTVDQVQDCVTAARTSHHLEPESLRFERTANGSAARVLGDPEELRAAVSNVIENAIKYSGEKVDVAVRVELPDDEHILLSVRD